MTPAASALPAQSDPDIGPTTGRDPALVPGGESAAGAGPGRGADVPDASAPGEDLLSLENLSVERILDLQIAGNPVRAWLVALAVLLLLMAAVWIVRRVLAVRVKKLAEHIATTWINLLVAMVHDIRMWLIFPAMVYVAAGSLMLPVAVGKVIQLAAVVGLSLQLLVTSRLVIDFVLNLLIKRIRTQEGSPDPTVQSSLGVLRAIAFAVIGVIVALLALDNLGIEITPMLTGLGIGGIAVALAVQNILGDLFGSLTIILDKPFVVGDFIIVGDKLGTVEKIGIKTTRVRALSGEQLVFSNNDLLSSRIQNFKRMFKRRIVFEVGVIYETTPEQLRMIPGIIREAVEKQEQTTFDRSHFKSFGAYSLDFETVYFVTVPDYNIYMDKQQAINLHIFEKFAEAGIDFAYPTQVEVQRVEKAPPPQYLARAAVVDGHGGGGQGDPAGEGADGE
jgi:small-conductance mechanosensitive channel